MKILDPTGTQTVSSNPSQSLYDCVTATLEFLVDIPFYASCVSRCPGVQVASSVVKLCASIPEDLGLILDRDIGKFS